MKPVLVQMIEGEAAACPFMTRTINQPSCSSDFHFHEECQLVYILEGEGKRIVGDNVEHFQSGELVFLGSNVPHVWYNDTHYLNACENLHARSIALYFNPGALLEHISKFIDIAPLQEMLNTAQRGMKFYGVAKWKLSGMLIQMQQLNGLQKFGMLVKILELMCETKEFSYLASAGYMNNYQRKDDSRMDRVFEYIFGHFTEDISLSDIARVANMNVQAFCRYFKVRTKKSFTHFVNEIRIGHACKLLISPEENITIIAHKCGFNSVSNFNRFFKDIKGMTPREFKKGLLV